MAEPQQNRSRRTRERIVQTARQMCSTRSFESISIAELVVKARVSIGCFYGHFRSKDDLALTLADSCFVDDIVKNAERQIHHQQQQKPLRSIIRSYIQMAADNFERNREILRAVALRVRMPGNTELRKEIRNANQRLHAAFRQAVLSRKSELHHPNPEVAFDMALLAVSAALREVFLFEQPVSQLAKVSRRQFIDELTQMFVSYTGADEVAKVKRRRA
jgi:AcrR family transcriptional regulator